MSGLSHRTALIVRGGWDGHEPVVATELFRPFLLQHGFEIQIEESTKIYGDADALSEFDLIVQCMTMSTIEADELRGLERAVVAGTGLAGWHGGIADSYRNSSDYLHLIGGQFACHPAKPAAECTGEQADNFLRHTIRIAPEQSEHPIVAGLTDFDLVTEQYWVLVDDYIDVLASTIHPARADQPWHRPITSPAVWTRHWGEGRIFVATPGHSVSVLRDPNVKTIIERGLLWASR